MSGSAPRSAFSSSSPSPSPADEGVNVEMASYGLDSINFTMLIDDADIDKAVKALHSMLFAAA